MLKFNRKVEYALISLLYLSKKPPGELTNNRELAELFSIPGEILGKVLQQLAQKDVIASVRGVKGGYFLEKSLKEITVHEVISAVERPIALVDCADKLCECAQSSCCNIKNPMLILQEKVAQFFDNLTLKDLKEEQEEKIYSI